MIDTKTVNQDTTMEWLTSNNISIAELMPQRLIQRLETTARKVPSSKKED